MNQTSPLLATNSIQSIMDKRLGTNLFAFGLICLSLWTAEPWKEPLLNMGLFALSGAITNWLAIYMLFEKVPGLYGSGIIPLHFEEFKKSIHELVMTQFFDRKNVQQFFADPEQVTAIPDLAPIVEKIDLNPAFDSFLEVIEESQFGSMLTMMGGIQALEPLREPFSIKFVSTIKDITQTEDFQAAMHEQLSESFVSDDILHKVDSIVNKRLEELSPQMVKEIIERMIKEHLGWLVVWGGVFGGLIGLLSSIVFYGTHF